MQRLRPPLVAIHKDVMSSPPARRRAERLLTGIEAGEIREVNDKELAELVRERWKPPRDSGRRAPEAADIALTNWRFDATTDEIAAFRRDYPELEWRSLDGSRGWALRPDGDLKFFGGAVCTSAFELHSIVGCAFGCTYCGLQYTLFNIACNIEDMVASLDDRLLENNFQTIYKWDNSTDINAFEPEYDATRLLVEYFRDKPEKYLLHYTGKSDNVDFMLDMDHGGKTIVQWSLSPATQARRIEPRTAPTEKRIEAMRKCQEAGYIVRCRFSPIVPVKNWREEYAEMIRQIFEKTRPDVISLCFFGWMDYHAMANCLDTDLVDPWALELADQKRAEVKDRRYGPFPHEVRYAVHRFLVDEIRKHSKTTPVSLCIESEDMWNEFREELGRTGDGFLCNCGPNCTPGTAFYESKQAFFAAKGT